MFGFSINLVIKPELFIRNIFMKAEHIQIIGLVSILYYLIHLYSFFKILPRKYAILITDDFLIDNSKYESIGEIRWSSITKIQRFKKRNVEVFLKSDLFKTDKRNLLKKFLTASHNWNYKKSILISSALTESNIEDLYEELTNTFNANK